MLIARPAAYTACLLSVLASGCAGTTASKGWLPKAAESQESAFGGWISLDLRDPERFDTLTREAVVGDGRAHVREEPSYRSAALSRLPKGARVRLIRQQRGWYEVEGPDSSRGWVPSRRIRLDPAGSVHGELVAVSGDSIFVLTLGGLMGFSIADVKRAKLTAYESGWENLALWSGLGTLSTLSHGLVLVFSAPVWILSGTIATSLQSHVPEFKYPGTSLKELGKYARFPLGLPPGLDRGSLRSKPVPNSRQDGG